MNRDDKRLFVTLTIVLSVLVVLLSGYLIYDKVINKEDEKVVEKDTNIDNEESENAEDNVTNEDNINKDENNNLEKNPIITELEKYKNIDGTYGSVKGLHYSIRDYAISLRVDGRVYLRKEKENSKVLNIENVIDMELYGADGYLFLLTSEGDIYLYDLYEFEKNNYSVRKMEEYNNIERLVSVSYAPHENAGGCSELLGVTEEKKYVRITGFCV